VPKFKPAFWASVPKFVFPSNSIKTTSDWRSKEKSPKSSLTKGLKIMQEISPEDRFIPFRSVEPSAMMVEICMKGVRQNIVKMASRKVEY
jgi:hypothetical protein